MGLIHCNKQVQGVQDQGVVFSRSKPGEPYYWLDGRVIREPVILREEAKNRYLLYYDALGPEEGTSGLLMLAESADLLCWNKLGPVQAPAALEYPKADYRDFANYSGAGSPWIIEEKGAYYMYNTSATGPKGLFAPLPYYTTLAFGASLAGPWQKESTIVGKSRHVAIPIRPGTYYSDTAAAGSVMINPDWQGEGDSRNRKYMMFFSAASFQGKDPKDPMSLARGIGIARTNDLAASDDYQKTEGNFWEPDPQPIIPLEEDVENATLFYDSLGKKWCLFVNHIHESNEYTDAVWVYWTDNPNRWDMENKAVVLSPENCSWTKGAIGMPSVVQVGNRLALFYDGSADGGTSHFGRDIAMAYVDLPLLAE